MICIVEYRLLPTTPTGVNGFGFQVDLELVVVALEAVPIDDEFNNDVFVFSTYCILLSVVFIFPAGILAISINTLRFIFIYFTVVLILHVWLLFSLAELSSFLVLLTS